MKKQILRLSILTLVALTALLTKTNAQYWTLTGNSGIDTNKNFLGTTDAKTVIFKANNVERMRIQYGGKVGIGTKKPAAKLNVNSTDLVSLTTPGILMLGNVGASNMALDGYTIQARYNGAASNLYLNNYGGSIYMGNSSSSYYGAVGYGSAYGLYGTSGYTGVYGTGTSYGLQGSSSNIGVYGSGTSYGVYGSGTSYGVYGSGSTGGYFYSSSGVGVEGFDAGNGQGVYAYEAGSGEALHGNAYGTFGYGCYGESKSYYGVVGITDNASSYAGFFQGNVYTTGSYLPSDLKLKQNVKDLTSAMNIIDQLHPKQYEYRQDGDYKLMNLPTGNRFGLIAEDVEKVLPGLVKDTRFEDRSMSKDNVPADPKNPDVQEKAATEKSGAVIEFKALNYTELIPIMIKGMQEQQQNIQDLQQTIESQNQVINKQQQQIDQLQQMAQSMINGSNVSDAKSVAVSSAYLLQNAPNPFTQNTMVKCYVPTAVKQAQLVIYSMSGQLLKSYTLTNGMNNVIINAGTLSSGQYTYSLLADGNKADSKNMILTK